MMEFFLANQSVFDFFLLTLGFSYSQQVVLRSGVFSLASAAFAALGSYGCAYMVMRAGLPVVFGVVFGALIGGVAGYLTSIPLARLRGVYQAIATLALVEVTVAVALYAEPITGGAVGFNGIPKAIGTGQLLLAITAVSYVLYAMSKSRIGRGFDALRQDEFVAASLGVSSRSQHTLAFIASGLIGGLFGALQSMYSYSIEPHQFGFGFMVSTLAAIVLGGRRTLLGPVVGSAIVILLPEIARPLADYRQIVVGSVLVIVILYTPQGLADTFIAWLKNRKNDASAQAAAADTTGGRHGNA
jgi:branched-chain amino acid transport system permease protein